MYTILIIEDNCDILENLTEFLEMEGFKILTAKNGSAGIELAKEFMPQLIICDVLMPGMNGFEFLHILVNTPLISQIAFVFSTSKSEKLDEAEALALGADGYIVKPFELESLLTIANACIQYGSKRARQKIWHT